MEGVDPSKFVFVDETGVNIGFTRLYGRAPRGERAYGSAPRRQGTSTTLITSLSTKGLGGSMTIEGAANGEIFTIYVRDILCPGLLPGQIVALDNHRIHEGEAVRLHIEAAGCTLRFLPAYSPDLTPVELAIGKIKECLRTIGARSQPALDEAITRAIGTITEDDAIGWFTHCGYETAA